METVVTTLLGLLLLGLIAYAVRELCRRQRESGEEAKDAKLWNVRAYSFQSELPFSEAMHMLEADDLGEWYERDSFWYDQLLSCRVRAGVRMNLYRFDDEWVLELKASAADADRVGFEKFVEETLLPALGAQAVKETGPVN